MAMVSVVYWRLQAGEWLSHFE